MILGAAACLFKYPSQEKPANSSILSRPMNPSGKESTVDVQLFYSSLGICPSRSQKVSKVQQLFYAKGYLLKQFFQHSIYYPGRNYIMINQTQIRDLTNLCKIRLRISAQGDYICILIKNYRYHFLIIPRYRCLFDLSVKRFLDCRDGQSSADSKNFPSSLQWF